MVEGLPRATPRAAGATLAFSVARPSAALMARLMRGEVHVWRARAEEAGSYLKRDCLSSVSTSARRGFGTARIASCSCSRARCCGSCSAST